MRRGRFSGRAGSLLVEALATLALSGLVLAGLVVGSGLLLRVVDRSVVHLQSVEHLDRAVAAVARDVQHAVRSRWTGREPQAFIFEGTPSRLLFVQGSAPTDNGRQRGESVVVIESLKGQPISRTVRLEAPLWPGARGPDALRFGPARPLHAGPLRLRFAYVEPVRPDGTEGAIRPAWPAGLVLPAAVVIEAVDPASGKVLLTARARLLVDADLGCLGGEGAFCGLPERQGDGRPEAVGAASVVAGGRLP